MEPDRKPVMLTVATVVAIAAVIILWFFGRPAFRNYRVTRAVEAAEKAMGKKDYRTASVAARKALLLNARNLKACVMMAEMAEAAKSPQAVDWRRRIVELDPTVEQKLALVRSGLRFEKPPYPITSQTLQDLSVVASNTAAFQVMAAELALRQGKASDAVRHFETASSLEPTNEAHRLNLAVLRLGSPDARIVAGARATLESLKGSTNFGAVALRWLVGESVKRKDFATADQWSGELLASPHSTFEDRLQHLSVIEARNDPARLKEELARTQTLASTNAAMVYGVALWMVSHKMAEPARTWLAGLPEAIRSQQVAKLAIVDTHFALKDWKGLEEFLQDQDWGENEYLRLAFFSTAAYENKEMMTAETRWRSAVRQAGDRLEALDRLRVLARQLGRLDEEENLLWRIYDRAPSQKGVLEELNRVYTASGNTRGLHRVFTTLDRLDPTNVFFQNNVAATSLLLKTNLAKAHELANHAYRQYPTNATVASTYAFSLYQQGHNGDALQVLQKLPPDSLEKGSIPLYYGLVLLSAGETNKASSYLDIASKAALLPEEKALLTPARERAKSASETKE